MITEISFKDNWNKKYYSNPIASESPINRLAEELINNSIMQEKLIQLVAELSQDLENANVMIAILKYFPRYSKEITEYTKKRRNYWVFGLTIHEEDK